MDSLSTNNSQFKYLLIVILSISIITCGRDNPTKPAPTTPARVVDKPSAAQVATEKSPVQPDSGKQQPPVHKLANAVVTDDSSAVDRTVLVALYNATDGANWTNSENWLSDEPLHTWHGVSTDTDGRVTRLALQNNGLTGAIPAEQLGQLEKLTDLALWSNGLTGTIPAELGQLQPLEYLQLTGNQLTGGIPAELGQLKNLKSLGLAHNQLTGPIPPELGQLESLTHLTLHNNVMTGSIPAELGQLQNLRALYLPYNQLTGEIPAELGQLKKLEYLDVSGNTGLVGPLPSSFLELKLEQIIIADTNLCVPSTAPFRQWVSSIPSRQITSFCPDRQQEALAALYNATGGANWTNSDNWLSDEPLDTWLGVSTDTDDRVTRLALQNNGLTGAIPAELGHLQHLAKLYLYDNVGLAGPLPSSLLELQLEVLYLTNTNLCVPPIPEFTQWLEGIPTVYAATCTDDREDYYILADFFFETNGAGWTNSDNWLSAEPLNTWHGVSTDADGRVIRLELIDNGLTGFIPSTLSNLSSLQKLIISQNPMTGGIPPELGELENLEILNLGSSALTGSIPPELGRLENLADLGLWENKLTGTIPPELGKLENLRRLSLGRNQLTGTIPAELGQLEKLTDLTLWSNGLTGGIPPELGQLQHLRFLQLSGNQLTGGIPPELGMLANLERINLNENGLSGGIPPELGQLQHLRFLQLSGNQLTGGIPPELGMLANLERINLNENGLSGGIPPELGQLRQLTELQLANNLLSGNIPNTFGDLASLQSLHLSGNSDMAGTIPLSLTNLSLDKLFLGGTGLCGPTDPVFQDWLRQLSNSWVRNCASGARRSAAYLTQATQSLDHPVPLVAGEPALLRVFLAAGDADINMPYVRAIFFQGEAEVYAVDIPSEESTVPKLVNETSLDSSANAVVPADVIVPGLEMVIEYGSADASEPASGFSGRIPESGRLALDVQEVMPFDLTLVPLVWRDDPDYSVVSEIEGLTPDDDLFRLTRDLLPVRDFNLAVREPVYTSLNPWVFETSTPLLNEVEAVRVLDGADGYYMGVVRDWGGVAYNSARASLSMLDDLVIAHELGHNLSLLHAPCKTSGLCCVDPGYPYRDGIIGAWGYDILRNELVRPETSDLMGGCTPEKWISDYHFSKSLRYRVEEEEPLLMAAGSSGSKSLLLWGGLTSAGEPYLEPTFVVNASPSLPRQTGAYQLLGMDARGNDLFSLQFNMPEIADGDGGSAFAFTMPVQRRWAGALSRIVLSGPEGIVEISSEGDRSAALLLDRFSGRVRGILRDWPEADVSIQAARRVLPDPDLEVVISRGIPDPASWVR